MAVGGIMSSKRRHEGYLCIDHRDSPGVPVNPAMIGKPDALLTAQGTMLESATVTCCHCQVVVVLNPLRTRPRGYCQKCDNYVCDSPVCSAECRPFQAVLEQAAEAALLTLAHSQTTVP